MGRLAGGDRLADVVPLTCADRLTGMGRLDGVQSYYTLDRNRADVTSV